MPLKEVVGGIYSLQPLPSRWLSLMLMGTLDSPVAHRTSTVHCPVRAMLAHPLGFGVVDRWSLLSCSCTGHVRCAMTSLLWLLPRTVHNCSLLAVDRWCRLPLLRWLTGHVRCTPDSPLNYSGAPFGNSREWAIRVELALVHRTLTGHCPVRHLQHTLKSFAPNLFESPTEFFLGLCCTLCTWDTRYLGKLISPRGLWWTSTTKIDYRKWLRPFPFQIECLQTIYIYCWTCHYLY
jgi:hypothetical protein